MYSRDPDGSDTRLSPLVNQTFPAEYHAPSPPLNAELPATCWRVAVGEPSGSGTTDHVTEDPETVATSRVPPLRSSAVSTAVPGVERTGKSHRPLALGRGDRQLIIVACPET